MSGIYIHIPFCERKCNYCDFYSIENKSLIPQFVDKLCREIELRSKNEAPNSSIQSIFFGGGTPSILETYHLERILNSLYRTYPIQNNTEITVECNPGTLSKKDMKAYQSMGINRLSLGIQSFNDAELKFLQRIHSSVEAVDSYLMARDCGFDNINIDLMFSLPIQDLKSWEFTLTKALELKPDHISAYSLIYEPDTPLYRALKDGKIVPHSVDSDSEFFLYTMNYLEDNHYIQYEVSNYSCHGKKCIHNLNYWYGGEYIGFGPSAHSYIGNKRSWNVRNIRNYIDLLTKKSLAIEGSEELSFKDKLYESVSLQLRAEGILREEFCRRFGFDPVLEDLFFDNLKENNLIGVSSNKLFLTKKGYLICDEITVKLLELYEIQIDCRK